jgi:hypothetical protein
LKFFLKLKLLKCLKGYEKKVCLESVWNTERFWVFQQIYLGVANELGKWSFLDEGVLVLLNCNVELIDQMVWLEYGSSLRQVAVCCPWSYPPPNTRKDFTKPIADLNPLLIIIIIARTTISRKANKPQKISLSFFGLGWKQTSFEEEGFGEYRVRMHRIWSR